MGIGAYDTNRMEARHFNTDIKTKEIKERKFLSNLDLSEDIQDLASIEIKKEEDKWNEFLQQKPSSAHSVRKGIYKTLACLLGGFIPLIPFMMIPESLPAFKLAGIIVFIMLLILGYIKGKSIGGNGYSEAFRTTLYTMLAATCIYYVVASIINN